MALDNAIIQERVQTQFGQAVSAFTIVHDLLQWEVTADQSHALIQFLKEDAQLRFNFLTDLCGMHFPDESAERQFAVVYHMHNWVDNVRVRIKCFLHGDQPNIDTISDLFAAANWQERETYDFYGIIFQGHPQLKRILNMDEMVSFPLRKEFPLEDGGRTDKDDRFFGRTTDNVTI